MTNTTSTDHKAFADAAHKGTGLIGYPINCLVGIIGNIICIIIYSRQNMRTSTNTYLAALAVTDLFKLLNDFMYFPTTLLHQMNPAGFEVLYAFYYPFAFFFSQFTSTLSAWLTVAVAFERFLMVVYPACSRGLLTVVKARISSAVITFVVAMVNVPCAMRYTTVHKYVNSSNSTNETNTMKWDVASSSLWQQHHFKKSYETGQSCFRSVVPVIILVLLNIRIIMSMWKTRANKKLASRNRVTMMLVTIIFFFIFLCMPDAIITILGWGYHDADDYLKKGIREITDMLLSINSAVNFWLYLTFNKIFQENFLEVFCSICRKKSPNSFENGKEGNVDVTYGKLDPSSQSKPLLYAESDECNQNRKNGSSSGYFLVETNIDNCGPKCNNELSKLTVSVSLHENHSARSTDL